MNVIQTNLSELSAFEIEKILSFLESNFSTIFHEPHFNKVVSEVFGTEFSYKLAYNNDGRLTALCPLHSVKKGLLKMTYSNPAIYSVPYGGWVYDKNEVTIPELLQEMDLSYNESLAYQSIPQIERNDYTLIKNKREFQTGVIDLTLPLKDILQQYISKKRRQAITRSSSQGIWVETLVPSNLNIFNDHIVSDRTHWDVSLNPLKF